MFLRSVTPDATFDLRLGSTAASKVSSASHSVPTETHEAKQEENGTLPPLPRSSGLDLGMPSSILYVRNLAPAVVATLAVAPSLPWGIWRHSGGGGATERPTDEREKKRGGGRSEEDEMTRRGGGRTCGKKRWQREIRERDSLLFQPFATFPLFFLG